MKKKTPEQRLLEDATHFTVSQTPFAKEMRSALRVGQQKLQGRKTASHDRIDTKNIGRPIGATNKPVDGDGDGFYTAVPGGKDNVPLPPDLQKPVRYIEAAFNDRGFRGQEYMYGDMDWEEAEDFDESQRAEAAYSEWASWEGNFRQRIVSAALMGEPVPPAEGKERGEKEVNDIIETGISKGQPEWAKNRARWSIKLTTWMMAAVDGAEPYEGRLFRGLSNVPEDATILSYKPGDMITMPLSAFSPDQKLADTFATPDPKRGGKSVMITLLPGAKGVRSPEGYETQIQTPSGEWQEVPIEVVTEGDFEVVAARTVNGVLQLTIRHVATYNGENVMPNKIKAAQKQKQAKIPTWVWSHMSGSFITEKKKPDTKR